MAVAVALVGLEEIAVRELVATVAQVLLPLFLEHQLQEQAVVVVAETQAAQAALAAAEMADRITAVELLLALQTRAAVVVVVVVVQALTAKQAAAAL